MILGAWNFICENIIKENNDISDSKDFGNYNNTDSSTYSNLKSLYAIHKKESGNIIIAENYNFGIIPKTAFPNNETHYLELGTGSSDKFKVYNIYDMAGNVMEETAECSEDGHAVSRGGSFVYNGEYSVTFAFGNATLNDTGYDLGFRVVLYLK